MHALGGRLAGHPCCAYPDYLSAAERKACVGDTRSDSVIRRCMLACQSKLRMWPSCGSHVKQGRLAGGSLPDAAALAAGV